LWEQAGDAAWVAGEYGASQLDHERAVEQYRRHGRPRDAARAQAGLGEALRIQGRHEQARGVLREALDVLSARPDADTVVALHRLAAVQTFSGATEEADQLAREALGLAQALGLPDPIFIDLFTVVGIELSSRSRYVEAAVALREAARRAESAQEGHRAGRALVNLSSQLLASDPPAAVAPARRAVEHCRSTGARGHLETATGNLVQALVVTGGWDEAAAALQAAAGDGLSELPYVAWVEIFLAVLTGRAIDVDHRLEAVRAAWADTEDVQDLACLALTEALVASSRGDAAGALRHARDALRMGHDLGTHAEPSRIGWPLAADAALALPDMAEVARLLDLLGGHPVGHLPPLLRAERSRIQARVLSVTGGWDEAAAAFEAAIEALRPCGAPYYLALGLVEQAEHLERAGQAQAAAAPATEALGIADRLGAVPLGARARIVLAACPTPTPA
ncbi:MAG: tetratricopeptide repeat protein, partial [Acidimicrobiales bacterium]